MRQLCLVPAAVLLVACAVEDAEVGSSSQSVATHNRLAGNRLAGNRLAGNRLAGNRLAGNRLSTNRLVANPRTSEILDTEAGRDVYSYIVSCALASGVTIEANVPSAPDTAPPNTNYTCVNHQCTFEGNLGLAPKWEKRKLDEKSQRWVSACLFARVNANDTAESISLRGTNDGLVVSQDEMELYTAEEGAFFGNFFIDDPNPSTPPEWYACRGRAKAACPGDTGCGGLANRDCTLEDPAHPGKTYCGFNYAGDCADFTPETPSAASCKDYDADQGIYGRCYTEAQEPRKKHRRWWGNWHHHGRDHGRKVKEVITVWVANN